METADNVLTISEGVSSSDVTRELLKQNQIIDEELNRYDKMLNTWPMILYKIWIFLYVVALSSGILAIFFVGIPSTLAGNNNLKYLGVLCLLVVVALLGISINGCVQMRLGLYYREIAKVNKSISIFETAAKYSTYAFISWLIQLSRANQLSFETAFVSFIPLGIALLNLLPAYSVKSVIEKRDVFQRVSSIPDNAV